MHPFTTTLLTASLTVLSMSGCTAHTPNTTTNAPAAAIDPSRGFSESQFQAAISTTPFSGNRAPGTNPATASATQVLVVLGHDLATPDRARFVSIAGYERRGTARAFERVLGPFAGVVGERGFAQPGEKREGDRRSPTGRFTITELFGEDPTFKPRMPYHVLTATDSWSEDPASPYYNQRIQLPTPPPAPPPTPSPAPATPAQGPSAVVEDLYQRAAVIDYNRWPAIPGAGSAIFMHLAEPDGAGTFGCVGLPQQQLDRVLMWLDPAKHPEIIMGTPAGLRKTTKP